jgi:large subunit ribosomal protein L24
MKKNTTTKAIAYKIRLKKGDTVMVRAGKDKGKTGTVLTVHPRENKVTVEGVNIVKKHQKPNREYPQGGIIELTKPIVVGKVGIVDPTTKKPTRIGYKLEEKAGKTVKTRIYKSSGKEIAEGKK